MYQVSDMVGMFDTGIQDTILPGGGPALRRRLFSLENQTAKQQRRQLLGFRSVAQRVGGSLSRGFMHALSGELLSCLG